MQPSISISLYELPRSLTVEALTRRIDLPLLWSAQEQALGIE
jgi:hypothetical protein